MPSREVTSKDGSSDRERGHLGSLDGRPFGSHGICIAAGRVERGKEKLDLHPLLPPPASNRLKESLVKKFLGSALALALLAFPAFAEDHSMTAAKDIVDVAVSSADHTTLVAAVKAAGLVDTLKGKGPFTLFAPTNAAFANLPAGTVENLLKPENKAALTKILTYHVVAGKLDAAAVAKAIKAGKGKATLATVAGGKITASMVGKNVVITDEKGGKSTVTAVNLKGSNGIIHVVDAVLLPN